MPQSEPPVSVGRKEREMRKMTITEGLAELKLLDSRISKAIKRDFIWSAKKAELTLAETDKHKAEAQANYASVKDLIENRNAIKSAIVKSNATTMVAIGGKEMTVAEAIERKTSIGYERRLRDEWVTQYSNAKKNADMMNDRVQGRIDGMLDQIAASNKPDIEDAQKVMSEAYMANNGWEVFDPLDLLKKAEELDKDIDEFEKNVDIALSMSNAVTTIEI